MLLENENLMNYEAERKFITSPYNKSSYYIPGKGITIDEDDNIRFYPLEEIDEFVYGQDIEPEFLFDDYLLTSEEKELIEQLRYCDEVLNAEELAAVYLRKEKNILFLFLTSQDNPEAFYKIRADKAEVLKKEELPSIPANTLDKALYIEI